MSLSILLQRFYENARSNPETLAVAYQEKSITYAELLRQVEFYAKKIVALTEGLENTAPICLLGSDKLSLVILQLAALRAGRFFAVLDHLSPESVVKKQIQDLGTRLTIVANHDHTDLKWQQAALCDHVFSIDELHAKSNLPLPEEISNDSLAYVLLTSGSTGASKAIMQTHLGLFHQMQRYYRIIGIENNVGERFSNFAPLCHDQGIVDIYAAMLSPKARLSMFDMQTLFASDDGVQRARYFLKAQEISVFSALPDIFNLIFSNDDVQRVLDFLKAQKMPVFSAVHEIFNTMFSLNQRENTFPALRVLAIGADRVGKECLRVFLKFCPKNSVFVNSYGASECSWICGHRITKEEAQKIINKLSENVPIGYPDRTLSILFKPLDGEDQASELCIAGEGLSPGYFGNEAATAQAFFTEDLGDGRGLQRFYRTGDLVSLEDGQLVHKGRLARIEKIAGKRVDINELEQFLCLRLQEKICIVVPVQLGEQKILCAFIKSKQQNQPTTSKVKRYLGIKNNALQLELAPHLRPTYLFELAELPTLPSGKINRSELAKIAGESLREVHEFKGSAVEHMVFSSMKRVLGAANSELWTEDLNSSMKSITRAVFRNAINTQLGNEMIHFSDFLEHPTPQQLAATIQRRLDNPIDPTKIVIEYYPGTKILKFTHEMIKRMLLYFMERSPQLNLQACISGSDFIIKLNNQLLAKTPRVGYTIPIPTFVNMSDDDRECHTLACLVDYNKSTNKLNIWISNSNGPEDYMPSLCDILLRSSLPINMVYCDRSDRQKDDCYNCIFDVFSFLTNTFEEPALSNWIIPLQQQDSPLLAYFQPPSREHIHRIPAFLDPSQTVCTLHQLGKFYSKVLIRLTQNQIMADLISPHHQAEQEDSNSQLLEIKTGYDLGGTLEPLNAMHRTGIFDTVKVTLPEIIKDAVDLGWALQYLNEAQCREACEILKDQLPRIIENAGDFGIVLCYLDESQCRVVYPALGSILVAITSDGHDFGRMLLSLDDVRYREVLQTLDSNLRRSNLSKNIGASFFVDVFRSQNEKRFSIMLEILKDPILKAINGPDSFERVRSLDKAQVCAVYDVVKDELVKNIKTGIDLLIVIPQVNETQYSKLIEALKDRLPEMINTHEDLGFLLEVCIEGTQYRNIYEIIAVKIPEIIKDIAAFSSMLDWLKRYVYYSQQIDVALSLILTPKTLVTLNWLKAEDISQHNFPPNVKDIILFKINEKNAIDAFFKAYPNWNGKTALQVSSMEEIISYACSGTNTQNMLSSTDAATKTQTRNTLISCGVNESILTKTSLIKEKSDHAVKQIVNQLNSLFRNSAQ